VTIDTAWKIAVAIFMAGVCFAGMRQIRKDQTGIANRGRSEAERNEFRFITVMVNQLIHTQDQEQREKVGQRFLNAWQGRR
jgi:hypothetical protein